MIVILLCRQGESVAGEGGGQGLSVHLTPRALEVIILPHRHVRTLNARMFVNKINTGCWNIVSSPWQSFSWRTGLPSWCWTRGRGRTGRWSRAWAPPGRSRHHPASSPSSGCSEDTPEEDIFVSKSCLLYLKCKSEIYWHWLLIIISVHIAPICNIFVDLHFDSFIKRKLRGLAWLVGILVKLIFSCFLWLVQ